MEELDGTVVTPSKYQPPQPAEPPSRDRTAPPALDRDGLVAQRPPESHDGDDDTMFQNYHWVAMLDPVELADGDGRWSRDPAVSPVEIIELRVVEHADRVCWEAVLRPTAAYDPRCGCCPLLFSARSDEVEAAAGAAVSGERLSSFDYADAYRVGLDVQTGVCVLTEELGGAHSGDGHRVHIEAVDEPMPESLFHLQGQRQRLG